MTDARKSRKRRKPRSRAAAQPRGYERSRRRNEEARAALEPLRPGERPTAVTVGAIAAALLAVANVAAAIAGFDFGRDHATTSSKLTGSLLAALILAVVAGGMWRARYWAVLGMQTLLGLTIVGTALALLRAVNAWAFVLTTAILLASGTLFWFLVKAMARIQMPDPPSSQRTG
jgi:hypothetical protein